MARARRLIAGALLALLVSVPFAAGAAALRTLHVTRFGMRAVPAGTVAAGRPFRVVIHVEVREGIGALDELVVPDLGTLRLLGDERAVAHGAGGTDITETLTLEAPVPGRYTLAPAYFDAIDARTGRASRFSADRPVTIVARETSASGGADRGFSFALVAFVALPTVAVIALLWGLARLLRARPRTAIAAPLAPSPPSVPRPVPSPREAVREALRRYRTTPATPQVLELRARLFAAAGAPAGATLRDAHAAAGDDRVLARALDAAEVAAFGPADARDAAAVRLIDATEEWLR